MGLSTSFIGLDHVHIKRDLDEAMMEAGAYIYVSEASGRGGGKLRTAVCMY